MQTHTAFLISFLKVSLITVLLMGGLLVQSYATTGLFTGVNMKVDCCWFSATVDMQGKFPVATINVLNQQQSNYKVSNHQVIVKTAPSSQNSQ